MTQMELQNEFDIEALLEAPYKKSDTSIVGEPTTEQNATEKINDDTSDKIENEKSQTSLRREDIEDNDSARSRKRRSSEKDDRDRSRDRHHRSSRRDSRDSSRDRRRRSRSRDRHHRRSHNSPDRRYRYDDRDYRRPSRYSRSPEDDRRRRRNSPPVAQGAGRQKSPPPTAPVDPQERDRRTVFCQQLSARLQNRDLYEFLSACGRIREAKIVIDKRTQRSKGVAYVEFYLEESVPKAIGMTGQKLMGIPIIVSASESEKNAEAALKAQEDAKQKEKALEDAKDEKQKSERAVPEIMTNRVIVGNLGISTNEEDIKSAFTECGKIDSVKLHVDPATGRSKGYAIVVYKHTYEARYAIKKLNGSEIKGKQIEVRPLNDSEDSFPRDNADLDDSDVQGVSLNSLSRVELMAKLARRNDILTPTITTSPSIPNAPEILESRCIVLKNMFISEETAAPNWQSETEADVAGECSKYGKIEHIAVDPQSQGFIYLKFDGIESAKNAIGALNGRYFGGREISAVFLGIGDYEAIYPSSS